MQANKQKMNPQLKIMGVLTLLFFGGIGLFVALPEGPARGMAITAITVLSIYSIFKVS
jgi:hypothetical protein